MRRCEGFGGRERTCAECGAERDRSVCWLRLRIDCSRARCGDEFRADGRPVLRAPLSVATTTRPSSISGSRSAGVELN